MWVALAAALAGPWEAGMDVERRHMTVLAGWSGANLLGGATGALLAEDPRWRSFHATNAAWNTVNLGIAAIGAIGVHRRARLEEPAPDALARQHRGLRTALAVNLALDGVYIGTGAVFVARGGELRGLDLRGMCASLIVQGAFLALFDAHFLHAHRARTR